MLKKQITLPHTWNVYENTRALLFGQRLTMCYILKTSHLKSTKPALKAVCPVTVNGAVFLMLSKGLNPKLIIQKTVLKTALRQIISEQKG